MSVRITPATYQQITTHAEAGYPNEICGILLGSDSEGGRTISGALAIENSCAADEQYHRFLITPQDMFRAERLARQQQLDVVGVYHSHPDDEARPSTYDRDHAAWTEWSYVIISVEAGHATATRAWKLRDERDAFDEDALAVTQRQL